MNRKNKKVLVAISGGVDSSVAALLLKQKGYNVMAIFMHFWKEGEGGTNKCCADSALADARRVCQILDIPFYTINFARSFREKIVDYFIDEYKIGNTPNPCVVCNKQIKIGGLIKKARELGYDYVATGHYAGVQLKSGKYHLYKAKDSDKDQSYFLNRLGQKELAHLLLPLADMTKPEVRVMAKKYKLPTAQKSESQEVCFIPEKSHNDFLKRNLKLKSGLIKDLAGKTLGKHQGLPLYTVGQRKGIEIGGTGPYYVVNSDRKKNILYVANQFDHPSLYSDMLIARDVNWVSGQEPKLPLKCEAVIRYRHKPVFCEIKNQKSKIKNEGRYYVKFFKPQRAITSGQSVVFYKGKELLGGGIII